MKKTVLLAIACAMVISAQRPRAAPPNGLVSRLLRTLVEETNSEQALRDVNTIWQTDRWFTFPKFEETAKNVAAIMRRAGLEDVEIGSPPADGVTQAGFWTMPLAWDVKTATLEIVEPAVPADQRVLADYQKVPASICMWSGPTAPGGVVTEVVLAASGAPQPDVKGKLVLGGRSSKRALAAAGALGIISDTTENRELADERGWVNSFGDNGWSFTKGSAPLVCFSITPRGSQLLRGLLAKGPVKVRANVDSRHYTGVYPYVTGVIRGSDGPNAEEVLSLGHLFEQGAHDNATGVSSIILLEKSQHPAAVNSAASQNSQTLHCGDIETNYSLEKAVEVKRAADMLVRCVSGEGAEGVLHRMPKMVLGVGETECAFLRARHARFRNREKVPEV